MTPLSENARIAAEAPLPETVIQQENRPAAQGFFSGQENSSERGAQSQQRRKVRRDERRPSLAPDLRRR